MNKYRSNNHDVCNLTQYNGLIGSVEYSSIIRLYKNYKSIDDNISLKGKNISIRLIGKGGQGRVYMLFESACGYIVIKISKKNRSIEKEIKALILCKEMVDKKVCPNFIYFYGSKSIKNFSIIMTEYANGNLEDWLKIKHSYEEWRCMMIQFLMGVLCMQVKLIAYHSDLKPKNIFYKKLINPNIKFEYTIESAGIESAGIESAGIESGGIESDKTIRYLVNTNGFMYMIADFGRIQSPLFSDNILNENSIKQYIANNTDLEHLINLPKRIVVNTLENIYSKDDLLKMIRLHNDKYFDQYLDNERAKIYRDMAKYPESIKEKMVYRSIAYYVVEKNYIDFGEIPDELMVMRLPPEEIIKQLDDWKHYSITDILSTFHEYQNIQHNSDFTDADTIKFKLSY